MIAILELIAAELNLNISTTCHHLRNKAYAQNSQELLDAMSSMVWHQILVDELKNLLHARKSVIDSLQKSLVGEKYDTYADEDEQEPIYAYCLHRFRGEFALGSATVELSTWIAMYAERNQIVRNSFYSLFPDVEFKIADVDALGVIKLRNASDAEKFKSNTEGFLRDIEHSNALSEFNQLMQQVKLMLEQEAPIPDLLTKLKTDAL